MTDTTGEFDAQAQGFEADDLSDDSQDFEPMSQEEAQLVTLMRIYDVLLGIYNDMDTVKAEALMDLHAMGKLLGPIPFFDMGPDNISTNEDTGAN